MINAPILSIDVEVVVPAVAALITRGKLEVARADVAHEGSIRTAVEAPGIILERAQVDLLEGVSGRRIVAKQRILQAPRSIVVAEKHAERVLGIAGASAVSATDSDAGINLKTRSAIGIDQLHRRRPLPCAAVAAGMAVDARGCIKQVVGIDADVDRRQGLERILHHRTPGDVVHDVGIHSIIEDLAVDAARRPLRAAHIGGRSRRRLG